MIRIVLLLRFTSSGSSTECPSGHWGSFPSSFSEIKNLRRVFTLGTLAFSPLIVFYFTLWYFILHAHGLLHGNKIKGNSLKISTDSSPCSSLLCGILLSKIPAPSAFSISSLCLLNSMTVCVWNAPFSTVAWKDFQLPDSQ